MSLIKLDHIVKTYQVGHEKRDVLKDLCLTIKEGSLVAIIGASGSGKTTLMNIIGLLDQPTLGEYQLRGQSFHNLNADDLARIRNQEIGFVFQFFYLLPRLNALENVMLPLQYQNIDPKLAQEKALHWLEKMGLTHVAQQKPQQLSGGQQQRVAIARALVTNPSLILADEPTGALDSKTSDDILNLFISLHAHTQKTIIIITHNPQIAEQCHRIIQLQDGEIIRDEERQK
ncbi:MAG: yknY [Gammaproteobacteria bacterium]|nr:yknY [Gammaproteobacteria bacterium]